MNSCLAIFLVLGANPVEQTATTTFVMPARIVTNQVNSIAVPAETAADFVLPKSTSQPRPIQPSAARNLQVVQGAVAHPIPYDEQPSPADG